MCCLREKSLKFRKYQGDNEINLNELISILNDVNKTVDNKLLKNILLPRETKEKRMAGKVKTHRIMTELFKLHITKDLNYSTI